MVASSVVSTILILNYHHRNADTHEMSDWVSVHPPSVFRRRQYHNQIHPDMMVLKNSGFTTQSGVESGLMLMNGQSTGDHRGQFRLRIFFLLLYVRRLQRIPAALIVRIYEIMGLT